MNKTNFNKIENLRDHFVHLGYDLGVYHGKEKSGSISMSQNYMLSNFYIINN